jgi:hypothetical protein
MGQSKTTKALVLRTLMRRADADGAVMFDVRSLALEIGRSADRTRDTVSLLKGQGVLVEGAVTYNARTIRIDLVRASAILAEEDAALDNPTWSASDIATLIECRQAGMSYTEICPIINKTKGQIAGKISYLVTEGLLKRGLSPIGMSSTNSMRKPRNWSRIRPEKRADVAPYMTAQPLRGPTLPPIVQPLVDPEPIVMAPEMEALDDEMSNDGAPRRTVTMRGQTQCEAIVDSGQFGYGIQYCSGEKLAMRSYCLECCRQFYHTHVRMGSPNHAVHGV